MSRPDPLPSGLVGDAARLLSRGPRHTLDLAREVLGLKGNDGAASAAIYTLLGPDRRFQVDARGVWTLAVSDELPGPPLSRLAYAVVDVETTGGSYAKGHRVTEVALVPVMAGRVEEGFETLVNPGRSIPPRIQGLTGITDGMVATAPPFEGVAQRVQEELDGRVFVAHNVPFDWSFVRQELLASVGDAPEPPLLCTVRLGRLLVPRLRSYGLDALTRHFGIPVHRRHRAYGDALATARLLLHLLMEAERLGIVDLDALHEALERRRRPSRGRSSGPRGGGPA